MRACAQSQQQNVLQHGQAVARTFDQLRLILEGKAEVPAPWRLPAWLTPGSAEAQALLHRLAPARTLRTYQIWHDCGKPYCVQEDAQGHRHFVDHAEHSARVWRALGGDARVARLMAQDMDAHLLRAEEISAFAAREDAASLWLTALAEVHANAQMFGGWESTSFKAKAKHLERRGKALLAHWRENREP